MKDKYIIKYSSLFFDDLMQVVSYIKYELNNVEAANNLVDEIEQKIIERSNCPVAFETYKSFAERKSEYYRIYVKNYTVFYVVKNNVMEVRRLLYSRRNFKGIIW